MNKLFNADSIGLMALFSQIANTNGLGTSQDKSYSGQINADMPVLSRAILTNLPRKSNLIRRAVELLPTDAVSTNWFFLNFSSGFKQDANLPITYLFNLCRRSKVLLREIFKQASILARQFGQAYIVVGVADNASFEDPIDFNKISSIRWIKLFQDYELTQSVDDPNIYLVRNTEFRVHRDRILFFHGQKRYDTDISFGNEYDIVHDSVITGLLEAYFHWYQGIQAGSSMLADYDVYTHGAEGIASGLETDNIEKNSEHRNLMLTRLQMLSLGRSTTRTLLYDKTLEDKPDTVTRSYAGANDIMDRLERAWAASSGLPRWKLFNESGSTGLASSVSSAQILRFEWSLATYSWISNNLKEPIIKLLSMVMSASDCYGAIPDEFNEDSVDFAVNLKLSALEQIELEDLNAKKNKTLIDSGIILAEEARLQYSTSGFNPMLSLFSTRKYNRLKLEKQKQFEANNTQKTDTIANKEDSNQPEE